MTQTITRHQELMDAAYDRWEKNPAWSKKDFWANIGPLELEAVCMGNLNYQVENGGFRQWVGNGYCTPETLFIIRRVLVRLGSPTAQQVLDLLDEVARIVETYGSEDEMDEYDFEQYVEEMDPLDGRFYQLNKQLMEELEAYFRKQ